MHLLFLKSLVWHMLQLPEIPEAWLDCPLKRQEEEQVKQLLQEAIWPSDIKEMLSKGLRSAAAPKDQPPLPPTGSPPIIAPVRLALMAMRHHSSCFGIDLFLYRYDIMSCSVLFSYTTSNICIYI